MKKNMIGCIIMKKEMYDVLEWDNFKGDEELRKLYNNLLQCFEGELEVNLYGLIHQYKTFRLFCFVNKDCLKEALNQWLDTMDYIIDAYNKDVETFKKITIESIKNRDDALEFFWEYQENGKRYLDIRDDKYNFRSKAMTLLKSFQELIENVIKREAILLNKVNIIEGYADGNKNYSKLFNIIENIFATPTCDFSRCVSNNLSGISVNQFRNIVAHSNFKLEDEKIYATYGKSKNLEFSLKEAEKFLYEIYRLRIFIKLTLNLTIDFMLAKHPELEQALRIIPETAIIDSNSFLNDIGINICSYEISNSVKIKDFNYSKEGEAYFILDIESRKLSEVDTIRYIFVTIYNLIPIFKMKNNFPDIHDILWVLKIKYCEKEKELNLFIGYDEIKILQSNPIGYAKMIRK